jgi:hypothetical protein
MSDSYNENDINVTNPFIQPINTIAKYREYLINRKHNNDCFNDNNDDVVEYTN